MKRRRLVLPAVVFVLSFGVLASTCAMYGITYDEPIYQSKAGQAADWLGLLWKSPALAVSDAAIAKYWHAKDQQPGFIKLWTAVTGATLGRLVPGGAAYRVGTALLAAACVTALFAFVASLWGRAAGLYAAGALLLMPRVFAHCHLSSLDAPIMALSFFTVAAVWQCARSKGGRAWAWAIAVGVLFGLALGTKLNAFFIPFIVLPWLLVWRRRRALAVGVALGALGPLVFWMTWPWLWHETWPRFVEYFQFHFRHYHVSVEYFGRFCELAPWHYPLVMGAITLPIVTGGLFCVGLPAAGRLRLSWRANGDGGERDAAVALVAWALLVNLVPACLPNVPKYGGVRLFLPVFPYLAIFAALGFRRVVDRLLASRVGRTSIVNVRQKLTALALTLALLEPLLAVAKCTPYHLSYYNALIGGLRGAAARGMEPTYWGDAYRAGALWLAKHAPQGATVWVEPVGFESAIRYFELGPLRPDLRFSSGRRGLTGADFALFQNKPIEMTESSRQLVATRTPAFVDGIEGVPLIYVFALP